MGVSGNKSLLTPALFLCSLHHQPVADRLRQTLQLQFGPTRAPTDLSRKPHVPSGTGLPQGDGSPHFIRLGQARCRHQRVVAGVEYQRRQFNGRQLRLG